MINIFKKRKPKKLWAVFLPEPKTLEEFKYIEIIQNYFLNLERFINRQMTSQVAFTFIQFQYKPKTVSPISRLRTEFVPDGEMIILDYDVFLSDFYDVIKSAKEMYSKKTLIISNGSFLIWILLHRCCDDTGNFHDLDSYKKWSNENGWCSNLNELEISLNQKQFQNAQNHAKKIIDLNTQQHIHPHTDAHVGIGNFFNIIGE